MTSGQDRPVLVTGATGTHGGAVAEALLAAGRPVRALTRHAGSARAQELAALGAELELETVASRSADIAAMYRFLGEIGYQVDLASVRARFPEVHWTAFADWVRAAVAPQVL